jgi:hypothetical protein
VSDLPAHLPAHLPECLLIVTAEVDEAVEAEWNRWYDTVHLPDALRCPGVLRGRRHVGDRGRQDGEGREADLTRPSTS